MSDKTKKKVSLARHIADWFKTEEGKEQFNNVQLEDGTEIRYEGNELAAGVVVTMIAKDGEAEKEIPVPGGEHKLGGDMAGKIMVVEEATGKVIEVKDATAEETESEEAEADKQAAEMIIGEIKANRKKMEELEAENTKLHKKVESLATQIVEGKVDKTKFAYDEDTERKKKRGQKYI